jgi:hypothetical protein
LDAIEHRAFSLTYALDNEHMAAIGSFAYTIAREDVPALVAEVRRLRAQVERLETLATEIEHGEWSEQWRENNVHGAIRSRFAEHG